LFSYFNHSDSSGKQYAIFHTRLVTIIIIHEQNNICGKTHLDGIKNEQTIICRLLFALLSSETEEKMHQMINIIINSTL